MRRVEGGQGLTPGVGGSRGGLAALTTGRAAARARMLWLALGARVTNPRPGRLQAAELPPLVRLSPSSVLAVPCIVSAMTTNFVARYSSWIPRDLF